MLKASYQNSFRTNQLHFMNSVRIFPDRYSCAIDSFLELWLNKLALLPNISNGNENMFFELLAFAKVQYDKIINRGPLIAGSEMALAHVREQVWEYLREKCPSLRAMDCNAQFSEIFTRQTFGYLSSSQKAALLSTFNHKANCSRCGLMSEVVIEVFLHYMTRLEPAGGTYWPELLVENSKSNQINCSRCNQFIGQNF